MRVRGMSVMAMLIAAGCSGSSPHVAATTTTTSPNSSTSTSAAVATSTTAAVTTIPTTSVVPRTTTAPQVRLDVTSVTAFNDCQAPDAQDNTGAKVTYAPSNAYDGDPTTAWRCLGHPPLGGRYGLDFTLGSASRITRVGAVGGYAKNDPLNPDIDRFQQNDRIFNARWSCWAGQTSLAELQQTFRDSRDMQMITVNWSGCDRIELEVLDVYPALAQSTSIGPVPPMDDTMVSEASILGSAGG